MGHLTKLEVRETAKEAGLSWVAERKEVMLATQLTVHSSCSSQITRSVQSPVNV